LLKASIKKSLTGFDLEAEFTIDSEILAVLGPSGSGKTMTLKCIAGLLQPDEGHIELNGKVLFDSAGRINLPAQQRKIGFIFQNYALFPHLTVNENIAYGITNHSKQQVNSRVNWLLDKMNIQNLGKRYPRQLSSGQQQRVALARALSHGPELLLLDEPFSALDTPRRERLEFELLALQKYYKGDILFVTHDLSQGYKLGSKIAVYDSGRMVQCGSKHDVVTSPINRTVARLTGVKNLIEGTVARITDSRVFISIPGIESPFQVSMNNMPEVKIDQTLAIGIRPEHIEIVSQPGENTILCRAQQVMEGVTSINYHFHFVNGSEVKHELETVAGRSSAPDIKENENYYLYMPPEHFIIITEQ
jgi:molybdate transport system ATP-binding protein